MITRRALWGWGLFGVLAWTGCKSHSTTAEPSTTEEGGEPTTVVMAINLGEEDEAGGCGAIIHAVRAAAQKGVRTREIDTRNQAAMEAASQKYRIVIQPTVVLLDGADGEVRRYEGESTGTIQALTTDLDRMAKK